MILYKSKLVKKFQVGNKFSYSPKAPVEGAGRRFGLSNLISGVTTPLPKEKEFTERERVKNYNVDNLTKYIKNTAKEFSDKEGLPLWESNTVAQDSIKKLWSNIGFERDASEYDVPWSAATVSNLVLALSNKDKSELKNFRTSSSHSSYIKDAFKAKNDPDFQYNMYKANKLSEINKEGVPEYKKFDVGDILFRGSSVGTTKNWDFDKFAGDEEGNNYSSHTDMITGKGKDSKGHFYEVTGGNRGTSRSELDRLGVDYDDDPETDSPSPDSLGGVFRTSKVYYNPETGQLKKNKYKGVLTYNNFLKERDNLVLDPAVPKELRAVETNVDKNPEMETVENPGGYTSLLNRRGNKKGILNK
jgi:hypothetical protein